jgi:hypothetical protein
MSVLWSPNIQVGGFESKRLDVSEVDEILIESEGYVYVEECE